MSDVNGGIVSRLREWHPGASDESTRALVLLAADWIERHRYDIDGLRKTVERLADSSRRWKPVEQEMPPAYTEVLGGCVIMGEWVEFITAWHKTHWYESVPSHWMAMPMPPTDLQRLLGREHPQEQPA